MSDSKVYYGAAIFNKEDLLEARKKNKIKLEYYSIKQKKLQEESQQYGIEVIKKEYTKDNIKIEKRRIDNISENAKKVINIIETLKKYKVTPIGLQDVVEDLLKEEKNSQ